MKNIFILLQLFEIHQPFLVFIGAFEIPVAAVSAFLRGHSQGLHHFLRGMVEQLGFPSNTLHASSLSANNKEVKQ